ncbi:MAG: signal recognition particle protein, partial [Mucinivorans sp.]
LKKMGNIKDIASMIPGVGKALKNVEMDNSMFKETEAIIHSMTPAERHDPSIINPSRKARIALGSGTDVVAVNKLLKQFDQMRSMMTKVASGKMPQMQKMARGRR